MVIGCHGYYYSPWCTANVQSLVLQYRVPSKYNAVVDCNISTVVCDEIK